MGDAYLFSLSFPAAKRTVGGMGLLVLVFNVNDEDVVEEGGTKAETAATDANGDLFHLLVLQCKSDSSRVYFWRPRNEDVISKVVFAIIESTVLQ